MDTNRLRAWWWVKQGLDGSLAGRPAAEVLERCGWMRSVGGAGPYIGLYARAGLSRADVDAAAAALQVHELPSARGCTYVLPRAHFALGLQMGQGFGDDASIATAKKYLGVTEDELERLRAAVLTALDGRVLDPRGLKDAVGDAVRNLGAEGKKRGQTTTLPLALGWLQSHGAIRRVPLNGRLDQQRYAYARWEPNPLAEPADPTTCAVRLARLFFGWIGPATLVHFQQFSGLGVKDSKAAVAGLGLLPIAPGDTRLLLPEDKAAFDAFVPPAEPRYSFLSNLDGLLLFRREVGTLLDGADATRGLWTEKGIQAGGALADLSNQAIVDRGRIVGVWDYDGVNGELVWATFGPADAAVRSEAVRVEAWIRTELGDARTFSLDSPESRAPRLAAIRGLCQG
jgi:hypothetical protein